MWLFLVYLLNHYVNRNSLILKSGFVQENGYGKFDLFYNTL